MSNIIYARIAQKIATDADWLAENPELLTGELALVLGPNNNISNFKVGTGARYADTPFFVNYAQNILVPSVVPGSVLPQPSTPNKLIVLSGGNYTQPIGGATLTAAANAFNLAFWDGATWAIILSLTVSVDLSGYLTIAAFNSAISQYVLIDDIYSPQGKNIFNPGDPNVQLGYYLNGNGTVTVNAAGNTSGFIPVSPSTTYTGSSVRFLEYYTAANTGAYTGALVSNASGSLTFTTPSNARFVRISWRVSAYATAQLELGSSVTAYEAYSPRTIKPSLIPPVTVSQIPDLGIEGVKIANKAITGQKVSFLNQSDNLLDINLADTQLDFLLSASTGNTSANTTYNTTGKVPVVAGQQYTIGNSPRVLVYYNSLGNRIGNYTTVSPFDPVTFIAPASCAFIRASFTKTGTNWTNARMNLGSSLLAWTKFGYAFDYTILFPAPTTAVKWTSEGDSITQNGGYQLLVAPVLNLTVTNTGVSGSKLSGPDADSMWQDARVNAIPVDTEILTLLACTNDWAQSKPIGSPDSANTSEVYGAFNAWIAKVYARIPTVKVYIMTTTWAKRIAPLPSGWTNVNTNALGLTPNDYAEALRIAAKRWNLRVIDTNLLWNSLNQDIYIPSTDGIHPNATGRPLIAFEIINALSHRIR